MVSKDNFIIATLLVFASVFLALSQAYGASPTPVKVMRVTMETNTVSLPGMGTIRCADTLTVGFEATGVVSKISVHEGDKVTKGQELVELDNSVLDAETAVKQAELEAAEAEVKYFTTEQAKMEMLHAKKAISDADFEKASRQLAMVRARRSTLKAELVALGAKKQQRILRSPITGVVAKRYVDMGAVVTPGLHRVLRLIRCNRMVAVIELGERYYRSVRPGLRVLLTVDALGGRELTTTIARMCPEIDKANRTFTVEALLDNPDLKLTGGMFVQARIEVTGPKPCVWLPKAALFQGKPGHQEVCVVRDGKVHKQEVTVGLELDDGVHISWTA